VRNVVPIGALVEVVAASDSLVPRSIKSNSQSVVDFVLFGVNSPGIELESNKERGGRS